MEAVKTLHNLLSTQALASTRRSHRTLLEDSSSRKVWRYDEIRLPLLRRTSFIVCMLGRIPNPIPDPALLLFNPIVKKFQTAFGY